MKYSKFGNKFCADSGIVNLMADLGEALNVNPEIIFMGGGNPAKIPEVEAVFSQQLHRLLNQDTARHQMLGVYQSPQGDEKLLKSLATLLRQEFNWSITEKNIAISNGSQAAFFVLFNMFAGECEDGSQRYIQLPLAPEYLGYADVGLSEDFFQSTRPEIELLDDHLFKYHVDFEHLKVTKQTAAVCVSRPTNPTGNVISDEELLKLDVIARANNIPLIIDGAYGTPFPNILFEDASPHWNDNTIVVLSLSKLGLPGARTGIVVGHEDVIADFTKANILTCLACGNLGPSLITPLFENGEVLRLSNEVIKPFYHDRVECAVDTFRQELSGLNYRIHKPEGAIFLWLWFEGLPITSQVLYQRLKSRGVLVCSGHHFFVGISDDWPHKNECIRVSYAQDKTVVAEGAAIIADEVRRAFSETSSPLLS